MAEVRIWLSNSLSALPDPGDDEADSSEHHDSHDNPKYDQPHLHRLLHGRGQGWHDTHELEGVVIQVERLVDSSTT